MKKYLFPENGTFYKASLHTHSTVSDGKLPSEEVKKLYQSLGYSVVAFTDHDLLMPETHLTDENFIAITAFELETVADRKTQELIHMNLYAKNPETYVTRCFNYGAFTPGNPIDDRTLARLPKEQKEMDLMPMGTSPEILNGIIEEARKEGFLVTLNHPQWSNMFQKDYIDLKGLWGVEVHNTGSLYSGFREEFQPVTDLWHQGEMVIPVAADDMHDPARSGIGWMMLKAPELTYDGIIRAMEQGDGYATTGPEILTMELENNILHIETKEESEAIIVRFKKRPGHKLATNTNVFDADLTKYLTIPEYRDGWISIYVRDMKGKEAWTRAYTVKELLS